MERYLIDWSKIKDLDDLKELLSCFSFACNDKEKFKKFIKDEK